MSVTQTQVPAQVVAPVQSIAVAPVVKTISKSPTVLLVEELISIQQKLDAITANKLIKRQDEIKKALQSVMKDSGADEDKPYVFHSTAGEVEFGPATNTVEVTDHALMIEKLTLDVFKVVAKVGITDLRKYLSAVEFESCTEATRGSRSIKSVRPA